MTIRPGGGARRPAARPIGRPAARRTTAAGTVRRTPRVRRASAGLSPIRAGAMLAVLLAAAGIYGVANSSAFRYSNLQIEGATLEVIPGAGHVSNLEFPERFNAALRTFLEGGARA